MSTSPSFSTDVAWVVAAAEEEEGENEWSRRRVNEFPFVTGIKMAAAALAMGDRSVACGVSILS